MDKKANEVQKQLEVTMAFVKAAEERRQRKTEREAYQELRRNNPLTDEEKAEHRQRFKGMLNKLKEGGK